MPHIRLYYHLVWSTKHRSETLRPQVREVLFDYLRSKAIGLGGTVYAVGGTLDHVHMVVTVPPSLAVGTFVGQIKGASAARFNKTHPNGVGIQWQAGYGAFTIERSRLSWYVRYVQNQ